MKTTSMGFSSFFLSPLADAACGAEFVDGSELLPSYLAELVPGGSFDALDLASPFLFFSFGIRVVTLAMGPLKLLVRDRVSISAVTDMPGRKRSFSLIRIL